MDMSLLCPLCMGVNFSSEEALLYDLICLATRNISCPLCSDVLQGFDKFTVHLSSHILKCDKNPIILKVDENVIKINEKLEKISLQRNCESTDCAQQSTNYLFLPFEPDLPNSNGSLVIGGESETNFNAEVWLDNDILETEKPQILDNFEPCNEILSFESENFVSPDSNVLQSDFQNDIPVSYMSTEGSQRQPANVVSENSKECLLCSTSFPNSGILSLHNELVHGDNARSTANLKYECSSCQKKFKMRGSLLIHLRVAHQIADDFIGSKNEFPEKDQDQQYYCNICFKFFKKEHYLLQHLKIHDEKQWNCDECGKLFTTKYFLKRHKRLHTGEMPYTCPICEKHFTFQQSYHRHMSYHNNEKPHSCDHCGRSFKELSTLYNHQRIHTGEKPYSCDVCGKRFRQRVSCLVHSRIHTGSEPYKCASCHKSFRYKVSLKNHKCVLQEDNPAII